MPAILLQRFQHGLIIGCKVKSLCDFTHWQRTIVALAVEENIAPAHLAEAL